MTSTPSFTFFCSYLLVFPLLVRFLFQELSWYPWLLPTLFYGRPPPDYGCAPRAFLDLHSPWCLWSQFPLRCGVGTPWSEHTVPGQCAHYPVAAYTPLGVLVVSVPSEMRCGYSPVGAHTPRSLGILPLLVPIVSAPFEMRCGQSPDRWRGGEETGAVAAGESI